MDTKNTYNPQWSELLKQAVAEPGAILTAYTNFYQYSVGNQLAAWSQCLAREIPLGPINTYKRWQSLNRQVRRGEKAIWLCQPMVVKDKEDETKMRTFFRWKPGWFVIAQTDGDTDAAPVTLPEWTEERALAKLGITRIAFDHTDGNVMGYAKDKSIAISPLSPMPHKTLFHELAHILLGHTEDTAHGATLPRSLREAEAESVALILCESLNVSGAEYCRGYVQHWLNGDVIPDASAQKIFSVANDILKAGFDTKDESDDD